MLLLDFSLLSLTLLRVLGGGGLAFDRRELTVEDAVEAVRSTALAFTTFTGSSFFVRFPGALALVGVFAFTSTFTLVVVLDEAEDAFDNVLLDFGSDLGSFC